MVAAAAAPGLGGNPNPYLGLGMIYPARVRSWGTPPYRRGIEPKGRIPMPRKHLFPLVVLLAAAAMAGLLALGRTVDLGRAAGGSTSEQPAIAFRIAQLDKAEKSLRSQLADLRKRPAAGPRTVYERAATPVATHAADDEHGDDHGDDEHHEAGGRDD
jgi:hypothetical protein